MHELGLARTILLRTVARIGAALLMAAWLTLALAGPGLAATDSGPASSSGNSTVLIAGVIGAVLAALWLLKPSRARPGPGKARHRADGSHTDDPPQ
jgi:hypothetical protein